MMKAKQKVIALFLCLLLSICLCACTEKDQTGNTDGSGASEKQSEVQTKESEETLIQETTAEQVVNEQRPYSGDMDWLDYVISCAANVDMDEITDEIYQSVQGIDITIAKFSHGIIVHFYDRYSYRLSAGQNGFCFPEVISIRNPEKYIGLEEFKLLNATTDDLSNYSAVDWDSICQITNLKTLEVLYFDAKRCEAEESDTAKTYTKLDNLSCFQSLDKLECLYLAGIELPTDISDLFFRRNKIHLEWCNISEASFKNSDRFQELPIELYLSFNNIKDARKLTALVKSDGTGIQYLDLSGNPLKKIGNPSSLENINVDYDTYIRLGLDKKYPN